MGPDATQSIAFSNGKEATVNGVIDGSTYPGQKLVHLILGTGIAIWWVTEPHCYAECHYDERRYDDCRGTVGRPISTTGYSRNFLR
jgi:hypothetical protein